MTIATSRARLAALCLVPAFALAACSGPAASPAADPTDAPTEAEPSPSPPRATPAPTQAPTDTPSETAAPTEAPTETTPTEESVELDQSCIDCHSDQEILASLATEPEAAEVESTGEG